MYLPKLVQYRSKRHTVSEFKGINRQRVCADGELYDALNMCSKDFPLLSSMPKSHIVKSFPYAKENNTLLFYNEGVGVVYGNGKYCTLNFKDEDITSFEFGEAYNSANILNFNKKTLFINKDKRYEFDPETNTLDEMGYSFFAEYEKKGSGGKRTRVRLSFVYDDLSEIGRFGSGQEDSPFPSDASVGDCFVRYLSFYRLVSKDSQGASNEWDYIPSLRLRVDIAEDHRKFKEGDYIQLKGLRYWKWSIRSLPDLERCFRIDSVDEEGRYITEPVATFTDMFNILTSLKFPSNDIYGYDDPYIDNAGNDLYLLEAEISAGMPELDFVLGNANRVWGCSNERGEIYACELGNARNWNVFEGIASDSYAVSVATPGDFTASVSYLGTPVFFKENEMIVINGSRPSSFSIQSYSYRGVSSDSPNGVCVVNDILYYKSGDGIYAYSGSRPLCVSEKLGSLIKELYSVSMEGEGDLLFLSGESENGSVHLVYDTKRNVWHRYKRGHTYGYIKYPDATLEICEHEGMPVAFTLFNGIPGEFNAEDPISADTKWLWESGDIFYNTSNRKYVRQIELDTEAEGASDLYISYNGGSYKHIGRFPPHKRGCCDITLFPWRCDYFRIRMQGEGDFVLYTVTKEIEEAEENG